jgi:hypothetical protein
MRNAAVGAIVALPSGLSSANGPRSRRRSTKAKMATAVAVASLVVLSLFVVGASGSPATGRIPLWTYQTSGTINSVSVSENGNYTAAGEQLSPTGGAILLFNRAGDLLWEHRTDSGVRNVAISDNGSHILAMGASEVLALDSNGSLLWTRTSSFGAISADGSRVAVFNQDHAAMLTWSGEVLWNSSAAGAICPYIGLCPVFVSQDGSLVANGLHGITMFNSNGSVAWFVTNGEANNIWTNSVALTPSGYLIAAALDINGENGTALLLTGQGVPLWEHHLDSEVDSTAVLQNGSTIGYVTDSSALFYDPNGTLLANYTTDGESTLLPTSNGTFLLGGGLDFPQAGNLVLFDSVGREMWSSPLQSVRTVAVSGDGAFAAAASGPFPGTAQGPSTLYFFSTTRNGSLLQGLEDSLVNFIQSPAFVLFETGTGVTMFALFGVLAAMLAGESPVWQEKLARGGSDWSHRGMNRMAKNLVVASTAGILVTVATYSYKTGPHLPPCTSACMIAYWFYGFPLPFYKETVIETVGIMYQLSTLSALADFLIFFGASFAVLTTLTWVRVIRHEAPTAQITSDEAE